MTTPASPNPISMVDVQTEFGGSNPISLSEYYKGGTYVPSSITASIPVSGAIDMSIFRGVTKMPPNLSDYLNLGSFQATTWNFSWQEVIGGNRNNTVYGTFSVGSQGYPLICNIYDAGGGDEFYTGASVVNLGGNRSGTATFNHIGGGGNSDVFGNPSPTFTMTNPYWVTARFRMDCNWMVHSHTRINFQVYKSDGTQLSASGFIDYNFNPAAGLGYSNPSGTTYNNSTYVDIPANSSVTYYVKCDMHWNGDYNYAGHWWSGISRINAYFVGYV